MQKKLQVKIKKRSLPQILTLYIFFAPFFLNFFQQFLHFPSFIKYTVDVAWVVALFFMFFTKAQVIHKKIFPFVLFVSFFFLYVFILYLFNYQSILYFLWGLRNNARFYVAFFAFIIFLDKEDINLCFKFIDIIFIVHAFVVFVQFFFLGYKWDYLGGIFGTTLGCNGHSLVLITIVCVKSLLLFLNDKESFIFCLLKCGISLVIAAMSELKFFFVIFVVIMMISFFLTKTSWKKILFAFIGVLLVSFASIVFVQIWGEDSVLNFDRLISLITAETYSSSRDLGRFTAISVLSETIMENDIHRIFGLGLGNCDTATFAILNTPFYQAHYFLNYDWISSAFLFLEIGVLGLIIFLSFFAMIFFVVLRLKKEQMDDSQMSLYAQITILMVFVCVMFVFYNSSLRTESGYIAYFMLALPFIGLEKNEHNLLN